jgi:F-type H+-transporting ATPase subunit b
MQAVVTASGAVHLIGQQTDTTSTTINEELNKPQNPILPETSEIIWATLAFIILLIAMFKLLPAIRKGMEARSERIRTNLDDAERVKAEAQTILDEYQRQLADAKNEANRIIEEARQTAESLRRDLVARAEADVAELRQRSAEDIQAAQDRALTDLRARVAELAIGAAEKVVEKSLDRDTNIALVENYINSVGSAR